MALFTQVRDVEHLCTELCIRITAGIEDVQHVVVICQPCQHPGLDLRQVAHHAHMPFRGHDGLAQEAPTLEVLHVDGAPLAGRPPARGGTVVAQWDRQCAAPCNV